MRHGPRPFAALTLALAAPLLLGAGPAAKVGVTVTGLRSAQGVVLACLSSAPDRFPDCREEQGDYRLTIPAAQAGTFDFYGVPPGRYAIALLHDENGNGKVDRALRMIPREGFGFSRDAPVRFGPPRFDTAAFQVSTGPVRQTIQMRYML
ncbi:DUF2141 domain-containing protein [Altericroceibacterium xinjiangense]|uniref:DUF2141 domain-containing protein n=1 Tax=Altericroceibacterium xinjiangense TaxID=762261 RepID=UPI001F494ACA|nr:DUF2141 domain-containing protein [Altericroceibacterium xinjiangense]